MSYLPFHLDNKQAAIKLKVTLAGEVLVHDFAPKYLGVTLERSLTYRKHTENVRDILKSRCNIISKLAGTDWGAPPPVLRTSAIALVYSVAEYCMPVWGRCAHVQHIHTFTVFHSRLSLIVKPKKLKFVTLSISVFSIFLR